MIKNINKDWFSKLEAEFAKPYFLELEQFIENRNKDAAIIYPPENLIFNALNLTNFNNIKVVILGQDPYHGPNQAMGLSFSVQTGNKLPPSLKNIYKELQTDVNFKPTTNGDLTKWAKQGVLLLNSVLTVEKSNPNSHANKGWENLTDHIIELISNQNNNIIFVLWGAYAQKKEKLIDNTKHLVLKSTHPSPFSAHKGFLGSKVFSNINNYLIQHNKQPINWQVDDGQLSLF